MNIFEANHISKSYSNHQALRQVSMHVPEGSIHGLLGPNGAGKTTLIRIINRITAPDSGELLFRGRTFGAEHMMNLGYLPEERGLYRKMRVGEQALYLARLKGLSKHDATQKLKFWFEKFDITHWWNTRVEELSKGMAQKIQFIVTVLHEPELLIFDEPFSGFDPVNASLLKKEVLELQRKGTTIIFSTHDMASVEELCDHITLIDNSEAILEGTVHKLKEQFKQNEYELIYKGETQYLTEAVHESFEIKSITPIDGDKHSAKIQLPEGTVGNDFLKNVVDRVQICSFQEILPAMNDIFIHAVSANSINPSHV